MTWLEVTGDQLHLIHCLIAFESSRIARFFMDAEKLRECLTAGDICLNCVVTWPWEHGYSSKTKGHRSFPLVGFVHRSWKVVTSPNWIKWKAKRIIFMLQTRDNKLIYHLRVCNVYQTTFVSATTRRLMRKKRLGIGCNTPRTAAEPA